MSCVEVYRELDVEKYIGKKIGVLRTNIEGREVVVRGDIYPSELLTNR